MTDVAIEDLPVEAQQSFNALLNDARTLEGFGDMSSSLDFYLRAYQAHPRNPEAVDGITQLIVTLLEAAVAGGRPDDLVALGSNLDAIMKIDDYLAKNKILVEAREAIIEFQ